ncbi:hypothetical protein ACT17_33850 [Mycolicibacterium conceptionense]|uniref:Uncharacterized protein n=2 Tax=Mycolicibacterium TaxID=1866885 RepID=A0ABR5G405_9MYCO|nr:hypothetical protein AA982_32005 [Mycolicibacterium senegalense]KLO54925.1 hypothetical protein ABW05_17460 [Mycolicibacterium senegalense]KMV13721.1 hypothetical protein ACT17_33850 [Mycolicibacterium conceptionense]
MCWPLDDEPDELDEPEDPDELDEPEDPDDEPDELDPEESDDDPEDELEDDDGSSTSGIGMGSMLSRSSGMSGGATGGCPLIISGPLALLTSVDQPPLPSVAPMLHDTWRLPADQLGSEIVL